MRPEEYEAKAKNWLWEQVMKKNRCMDDRDVRDFLDGLYESTRN